MVRLTYKGILATIGNTPIVELQNLSPKPEVRIFAKLEGQNPTGSVKDRIGLKMIERAEADGEISPNRTILEPTSGNTGISLAMIGRLKGYKVTVVMPENVSEERTQLLSAYGAEIIYSDGSQGTNGSIVVAQDILEKNPHDYLMMYQYGNSGNPDAHYEGTGQEIVETLPEVDMFVAGLGTGGTLMGVARRLKEHNSNIKIVAVARNRMTSYPVCAVWRTVLSLPFWTSTCWTPGCWWGVSTPSAPPKSFWPRKASLPGYPPVRLFMGPCGRRNGWIRAT